MISDGFMTAETKQTISFGDICVDTRTSLVFKAGIPVQLEPKGLRLLTFLIENRERLVEKSEILDAVWRGTVVTEYALTGAIAKLRKAIGDDKKTPRYIQTVHTRGYRFIAAVELNAAPGGKATETNGEQTTAVAGDSLPAEPPTSCMSVAGKAVARNSLCRLPWPRSLALAGALGVLVSAAWLWNTSHHTSQAAVRNESGGQEHLQQARRYTNNPEAYEAFLKGHYFMNKATKDGLIKGVEYFRQAIALDPKYAMAYAGLADSYRRRGRYGVAPAEFVPKSRAAIVKALELDDTVAYAHSMLGLIAYQYDWDFDKANREYKRAQELDPTLVHQWYGSYLQAINRIPEAEIEFKRFSDSQPFLLSGNATYGQYFFLTHQYDRALDQMRQTLEMDANYPPARETLGLIYEEQGRTREALAEFESAVSLSHGENGLGSLGYIYAQQGREGDARKVLRLLAERSRHAYVSPYETALVFAGLNHNDQALEYLKSACAERSLSMPWLRFDPRLSKVREEPRFQEFIRGIGFSF